MRNVFGERRVPGIFDNIQDDLLTALQATLSTSAFAAFVDRHRDLDYWPARSFVPQRRPEGDGPRCG